VATRNLLISEYKIRGVYVMGGMMRENSDEMGGTEWGDKGKQS